MKLAFLVALALALVPADDPVPVDFATLSDFDYEPGMELPEEVRRLDGSKVRVSGFIRTEDGRTDDISVFWLVNQNCDCQGTPRINELILCTMPDGETISNDDSLIEATGLFEAAEQRKDDYVVSLYRMRVRSVR